MTATRPVHTGKATVGRTRTNSVLFILQNAHVNTVMYIEVDEVSKPVGY